MTKLRRYLLIGTAVCAGAAAFFAQDAIAYVNAATRPTPPSVEAASLKVMTDTGHGSGVHIGGGFILTASHVAGDAKTVKVKTKGGELRIADVLWVNKEYDIALLRAPQQRLASAKLDCRTAKEGETIVATGNPMAIEFVSSFGKIAGEPRETGPWKSVFITDITTVQGQSGGGVFDSNGNLIGITVGVMGARMGMFPSLVGFGFVVPSSEVCGLLARS